MVREKFEDYIIDNGFMFKGLEFYLDYQIENN